MLNQLMSGSIFHHPAFEKWLRGRQHRWLRFCVVKLAQISAKTVEKLEGGDWKRVLCSSEGPDGVGFRSSVPLEQGP